MDGFLKHGLIYVILCSKWHPVNVANSAKYRNKILIFVGSYFRARFNTELCVFVPTLGGLLSRKKKQNNCYRRIREGMEGGTEKIYTENCVSKVLIVMQQIKNLLLILPFAAYILSRTT